MQVLHAVLGTAGHIDHGKSSLVRALTGTNPDRFREEQERGMTIDIGFAEYRTPEGVDVGLIDVPGHERFIRNMVAGAVGMDMVMLVVAADDSIMPQTREHLEIMTLLGLKRGFVVITKIDMVEKDLLELVEEEVKEFLVGTFLEDACMLHVNSLDGTGVPEVAQTIDRMVAELPPRDMGGVFRMPVQRSFTLKGHGTVLTGVPVSGEIRAGDTLEVLPAGRTCRVRSIQVHHRPAESGGAGQRTAINVTDVNYREVKRGDVIAGAGFFAPATLVEARFRLLPSWKGAMKNNVPIRLHTGCAETMGRLVLLESKSMEPGCEGLVQFRLEEPIVVAPGDLYLVRLASPERTLGGGVILGQTRYRFKRFRDWIHGNLVGKEESLGDRERYLEYVIRSEGLHTVPRDRLAVLVKEERERVDEHIDALLESGKIAELPGTKEVIHSDMLARGAEDLCKALLTLHEADHYPYGFTVQAIASRMKHPIPVAQLFLETARQQKMVATNAGQNRLKAFKGSVSNEDRRLLGGIEDAIRKGEFATPIPQQLADDLGKPKKRIQNILTLLESWSRVVKLEDNVYLHMEWVHEARNRLVAYCEEHGEIPSNKMKDLIDATRKYVIPLLEYFDRQGLTVRDGSSRTLKEGFETVLVPAEE